MGRGHEDGNRPGMPGRNDGRRRRAGGIDHRDGVRSPQFTRLSRTAERIREADAPRIEPDYAGKRAEPRQV